MKKYIFGLIIVNLFFLTGIRANADYYVQRLEMGADTPSFQDGEYYVKTPDDLDEDESNDSNNTEINYNYYAPYYPYMYYPTGYRVFGSSFGINIGGNNPGPNPGSKPGPKPKPPSSSPSQAPSMQNNAPGSQIQKWYGGNNHLKPPML